MNTGFSNIGSTPLGQANGKGPLNLLHDINWIKCGVDLENLKRMSRKMAPPFYSPNPIRTSFNIFIREQLRHVFAERLQLKHARWDGMQDAVISATTALFRKMHPQAYGRTALMRLLSNAHATPHRLHKQDIVSTPACNFCGCGDADILHIAFHCPRFQFIRDEWSPLTLTWPGWPACAQHCLVATTTLPEHIRKHCRFRV